ncbi:hypothetical protein SETIT_8G118800v2 [Setaria italica]|uniref:Uncharacterized protein n=1 Tax=Setaria italica TaxID=4555 RepID=A0A368S6S9_SETIT|nr:hypothetical protein SETIT_8G118800v2 [Setaria italica]
MEKRSCRLTSKPKKTQEEALEAVAGLAIKHIKRELNIEIEDLSYEAKEILEERQKVFKTQMSRLDATSAELIEQGRSTRNIWATMLKEMKGVRMVPFYIKEQTRALHYTLMLWMAVLIQIT